MIQVYVPIRPGKRITLPTVACRGMQVKDGDWLRLTPYVDGRSVLERMPVQSPEPLGSVPAFPVADDAIVD